MTYSVQKPPSIAQATQRILRMKSLSLLEATKIIWVICYTALHNRNTIFSPYHTLKLYPSIGQGSTEMNRDE